MRQLQEIEVDSFAGGGGASTGIELATGRPPAIAINHDAIALAMHAANHPGTLHMPHNVWKVDPDAVCDGRPVGLMWASPDCKHFSKAKGGKPLNKNIRDLAWVVVRWAKQVKPRIIILENVEEYQTWGPLGADGMPCAKRKGQTFKKWVRELRKLGYVVEWRQLVAANYGAPTIRKRLFLIARCDGRPIVWPEPTHSFVPLKNGKATVWPKDGTKPWRTAAAHVIDWSIPCHSIFLNKEEGRALGVKRPLVRNTMARLAHGVKRYVLESEEPFVVSLTHHGDHRVHGVAEPTKTITAAHRGEKALVQPFVTKFRGERPGVGVDEPLPTVTANSFVKRPGGAPSMGLVMPHLMTMRNSDKPFNEADKPTHTVTAGGAGLALVSPVVTYAQQGGANRDVNEPVHTITASRKDQNAVMVPVLVNTRNGEREGQAPRVRDVNEPAPTVTAGGSQGAVAVAFLAQHNTDMVGHDAREPVSTIVQKGSTQAVVSAGLVSLKGTERRDQEIEKPTPAVTAGGTHVGESRVFLTKYFGTEQDPRLEEPLHTATTKDRFGVGEVKTSAPPLSPEQYARARQVAEFLREFGCWNGGDLVTIGDYVVVDIGMRMLTPRELFRAQGFRADYVISHGIAVADDKKRGWKKGDRIEITKTDQIRMCGNSVCPDVAAALVGANYKPNEAPVAKPRRRRTPASAPLFGVAA